MTTQSLVRYATLLPREMRRSYAAEYQWYPDPFSWAVRVYDRILRQAPRLPLPGRKFLARLRFRGMGAPFYARLGSSDLQLHQTIRFRGEYSPLLRTPLRGPIRQVIDLGANAGYTLLLWRELFPGARLIAVEPDPDNLRVCGLNAKSRPGVRVDLIQACVDGRSGTVWLDRSQAEHQFRMGADRTRRGLEVPAVTVPEILARAGADEEIGLLKCDIQGAERAVFADCRAWIGRVKNLVVEVHPPYTEHDLLADLIRNGWQWRECEAHVTDQLTVLFFRALEGDEMLTVPPALSENPLRAIAPVRRMTG